MANYLPLKMKRKDMDYVNDEFCEFSLSSPARKNRRLDADLPPIIDEDETEVPLQFDHGSSMGSVHEQLRPPLTEELPTVSKKEERSIVLFKPMNESFLQSNFSVDPQILAELKNKGVWSTQSSPLVQLADESNENKSEKTAGSNKCLAVIPWNPSQQNLHIQEVDASYATASESMDADDMEVGAMDIEENVTFSSTGQQMPVECDAVLMGSNDGIQRQWQRQHCMIQQLPENTTAQLSGLGECKRGTCSNCIL